MKNTIKVNNRTSDLAEVVAGALAIQSQSTLRWLDLRDTDKVRTVIVKYKGKSANRLVNS